MSELSSLPVEALIVQFEKDIIFNPHGYLSRFERSGAQQELCRRGFAVLMPIMNHLKSNPPENIYDLPRAWIHLLSWILIDIEPKKKQIPGPANLKEWLDWAEEVIATEAVRAEARALA